MSQFIATKDESSMEAPAASIPCPPNGRGTLAAFVFSLAICQGLTINLMPVVLDVVAKAFGVESLGRQGLLQTTFQAGGICSLFISGYVTEYIRPVRAGLLAATLMSVGLITLGVGVTYSQVLLAALLLGIGNYAMLAPYSAVITESFADCRQRMFMWVLAVFALSATIGNLTIGFLIARIATWQTIPIVIGIGVMSWFLGLLAVGGHRLRTLNRNQNSPLERIYPEGGTSSLLRIVGSYLYSGLLNRGTLWVLSLLVVLDNFAAGNMVAWTARYFQLEYQVGNDKVGAMLSASAAGVCVGRVLLGTFVTGRYSDLAVLGACYAGAVATYGLLLTVSNYYLAVALFFLCGALISAQAPTMYSIASAKFGPRAATAIPLVDGIGYLGSFLGPVAIGALADNSSLRSVLWLIPATGVVFVTIVASWELIDRTNKCSTVRSSDAAD
jgi:MFS family permease